MPPLINENLIIQGNGVDGIAAFHKKSGHEVWSLKLKNGVEGGAALDGDHLFFGSNDGSFYCLESFSGRVIWKIALQSESLTQPIVNDQTVYHVTANNTLYALDKNTGQILWVKANAAKSNMSLRGQTTPLYHQGVLYLGFSDGMFSAINAENGRELWSKRLGDDKKFTDVDASPRIYDNCLLVASYANALFCLDKNTGHTHWRHDRGGYQAATVYGDKVYYPTADGTLDILDLSSGKLLKQIVKIQGLSTEVVVANDKLIYGETSGAVIVRDLSTLEKEDQYWTGRGVFARPTFDNKGQALYVVSNQGNLYRLDLISKPSNPFRWSHNYEK